MFGYFKIDVRDVDEKRRSVRSEPPAEHDHGQGNPALGHVDYDAAIEAFCQMNNIAIPPKAIAARRAQKEAKRKALEEAAKRR